MKKCKYCKSEIDKKAKICPHCGKKQKNSTAMVLIAIVIIITVFIVSAIGDDDSGTSNTGGNTAETSVYETQQALYSDDKLDVKFLKAYEEPSISGVFYLQLDVKNGFDKRVMIVLDDAVVNDYSTLTMSGVPMEIEPGSRSTSPFFYNESNVGMEKMDDLKTIKFKVNVYDADSMETLFTSEQITIDFTK